MELNEILESLKSGKVNVPEAKKLLALHSIEKIENFARIDIGRKNRRGIPEVVFAEKKQYSEIEKIIRKTLSRSDSVVVSRIKKTDYSRVVSFLKKSKLKFQKGKNNTTLLIFNKSIKKSKGKVGILAAGTSDIGVAEEARLMLESMSIECICSYDVGVAGIHRVFPKLKELVENDVDVIIVVAGMEGALATVVSSLVDVPVIGVPVSVGYGYGEKGMAALASMLQSCSLGLSVVNIDNGIGAGAVAGSIVNQINRKKH